MNQSMNQSMSSKSEVQSLRRKSAEKMSASVCKKSNFTDQIIRRIEFYDRICSAFAKFLSRLRDAVSSLALKILTHL